MYTLKLALSAVIVVFISTKIVSFMFDIPQDMVQLLVAFIVAIAVHFKTQSDWKN